PATACPETRYPKVIWLSSSIRFSASPVDFENSSVERSRRSVQHSCRGLTVKRANKPTFLSRNVRFVWLAALVVPPTAAFFIYDLMPHEEIWQEILYSLLCLPIFAIWLVTLCGCLLSFLIYRSMIGARSC